jgi:butyryl-CoA dehydrogenase
MGALADTIIEVFAFESCLLRAEKLLARNGEVSAKNAIAMTKYYAAKAIQVIELSARKVIAAVAEGDMLRTQIAILRRLAKHEPLNTIALSRQIAKSVLAAGKYTI